MEEIIVVDNLKCNGCASTITSRLSSLEGVQSVEVTVDDAEVKVQHEGRVARPEFIHALEKMGSPELGTSNLYQKAVSYISCASGKLSS